MASIGILAYGSLISDPGPELEPLIIQRIATVTPFKVEFKRSSYSRFGAPTLIPVKEGGRTVAAQILVLQEGAIEEYKSMLWRRERHIDDNTQVYTEPTKPSLNSIIVQELKKYGGVETVLYTEIGQNIPEPITGKRLAELAIESYLAGTDGVHNDGIHYLQDVLTNGVITELSDAYVSEILRQTGTKSLEKAMNALRLKR